MEHEVAAYRAAGVAARDAARARGEDVDPECEADETCMACGGQCPFAYAPPVQWTPRPPVKGTVVGQRVWTQYGYGRVAARRTGSGGYPEVLIVWDSPYEDAMWVMESECY